MELRIEHITMQFGGLKALNDVSLTIERGERRGVIGPNGAGKTTLFRIISGEMRPSGGQTWFRGHRLDGMTPERRAALGLSRTFQRSSLFPEQSVLKNVALARAAVTGLTGTFWKPLQPDEAAWEILEQVGLQDKAHWPAGTLSHGEQRQLEIAMALAQKPKLLLLDEPLAGLAGVEREQVGRLLHGLPRDITVLLIEHDLGFVQGFADRITVLHYGQVLAEGPPEVIRDDPRVQEVYMGQGQTAAATVPSGAGGPPRLEVRDLHAGYGATRVLQGVDLHIRQGEVVALLGRNGMGKTTLLHTLMGFLPVIQGDITLRGRSVTRLPAEERARLGLALVPQGRRMLSGLRVHEELVLAAAPGPWTIERVYSLFPQVNERRRFYSTSLSGGEQQMVAIGRALLRNPQVLLMDEPTEGLSPRIVQQVRDTIVALKAEGETILLAEQNVDMALSVADRVYVLEHGRVVFNGTPAELSAQPALMKRWLGVG